MTRDPPAEVLVLLSQSLGTSHRLPPGRRAAAGSAVGAVIAEAVAVAAAVLDDVGGGPATAQP